MPLRAVGCNAPDEVAASLRSVADRIRINQIGTDVISRIVYIISWSGWLDHLIAKKIAGFGQCL